MYTFICFVLFCFSTHVTAASPTQLTLLTLLTVSTYLPTTQNGSSVAAVAAEPYRITHALGGPTILSLICMQHVGSIQNPCA